VPCRLPRRLAPVKRVLCRELLQRRRRAHRSESLGIRYAEGPVLSYGVPSRWPARRLSQ
jgi:hypothetical protein